MAIPPIKWTPSPNVSSRGGQKVRLIVTHDCEGNYAGSISWFAMKQSQVSAHLVLRDDGAEATQMVAWGDKAWHACFAGDERVMTRNGSVSFKELSGADCDLLTPDGFRSVPIRSFGVQKLNRVVFATATEVAHWRNGKRFWRAAGRNRKKTVHVTADHAWPLANGRLTTRLAVGDVVMPGVRRPDKSSPEYRLGVRDGFVFGDGYLQSAEKQHMRFAAPMHGRDKEHVGAYFDDVAFWPSRASREHTYRGTGLCNSARNLKEVPSIDSDPDYLSGFMNGWIVADGCDRGDFYTLACVNRAALDFASEIAPIAGLSVCGPVQTSVGSGYKEATECFVLNLRKAPLNWIVLSIDSDGEEEVFCAQFDASEENKLFILDGGLLTHNCNFNPFSEGIEAAGFAAKGFGAPELDSLAAVVAWRLQANGIPCQAATAANKWTGFATHAMLGAAGGGHHDFTENMTVWADFVARVQTAHSQTVYPQVLDLPPSPPPAAPPGYVPNPSPRIDDVDRRKAAAAAFMTAVEAFQTASSLPVDGDPGPGTRAAFLAALDS